MTLTPPVITPVAVDPISITFRANQDLQPFSYRSTMTFGELLNSMKNWMYNVLVPYLNTNFEDITGSWLDNITQIDTAINTALSAQADQINSALTTQQQQVADELATTLNQITSGESAALNDSAVYNALRVANSQTLALLDSRYMKSGYFVVVNQLPGIVLDGSADVSGILNTALAATPANSFTNLVVYPNAFGFAKLRIDNTVTIDVVKSGIVAPYGGLTFDASHINVTNGVAMNITASAAIANNGAAGGVKIGPFRLIGPGRSNTGTVGLLLSTPTAGGGALGQIRDVIADSIHVEEFGVGHQYNNNAYCFPFINATIKGCSIDIQMLNAGERITYISSVFSDSPVGVQGHTQGGAIFIGCSFDYHTINVIDVDVETQVELQNCHVERSVVGPDPWFKIGTTGGQIKMFGGRLVGSGAYDPATANPYIVNNACVNTNSHGLALFDGVEFSNTLQASSGFFATGGGVVIVRNSNRQNQYQQAFLCTSNAMNLLARGNADAGTSIVDKWIVTADSATISSSGWVSGNIVAANGSLTAQTTIARSGTRALRLTKTGAVGTALAYAVVVPISRAQTIGFMGYVARHGAVTGSVTITGQACILGGDDTHVPTLYQPAIGATNTLSMTTDLSSVDSWVQVATGNHRAPAYATHYAVIFDVTAMGPGDLYIDDLCITES